MSDLKALHFESNTTCPHSTAPSKLLANSEVRPLLVILSEALAMYLSDAYTVGFSLGGLPTLSTPKGTATGLQITADKKKDAEVLQFGIFLNDIL